MLFVYHTSELPRMGTSFWALLPQIFRPWREGHNEINRQLLKHISITTVWHDTNVEDVICWDINILLRLLELEQTGVISDIRYFYSGRGGITIDELWFDIIIQVFFFQP